MSMSVREKESHNAMILLAACLAMIALSGVQAFGSEITDISTVPTDSWLYNELDWLLLNPPADKYMQLSTRPYSRDELRLIAEDSEKRGRVAEWKRAQILADFDKIVWYAPKQIPELQFRFRTSPFSMMHFADTLEPLYRVGVKQEFALSYKNNLTFYVRGRLENKGELDSFNRARKWEDKLTGYFDYALISFKKSGFFIQYGRSYRIWGPGDTDRLLLSGNSPSFDQLYARFAYRRFMIQTFLTRLNDFHPAEDTTYQRYFAAHRISLRLRSNLEIGISETALYGRQGSGPEMYYMNPILPYYWEQYNSGQDDNIYIGLDFVWWPFKGTRTYGELMIDDFQIDFVSEAQQVGYDVGVSSNGFAGTDRLRFDFQYTHVMNYIYGQIYPRNIYTNRGVIIGSSLGPDADRTRLKAQYAVSRYFTLNAGGMFARRGEGRITDPQLGGVPKGEKFPSGTVQETLKLNLGLSVIFAPLLDIRLDAGYFKVNNPDNLTGRIESPFLDLSIHYDFQRWFLF